MPDSDLIAIRMRMTGGRQVAAEANAANKAIAGTGLAAQKSAQTSSAAFRKQAAMMKATGRTMTFGLTAPLTLVGAMAVKTAANFDKSMAQVRTATGLGGQGMHQMESLALKWGSESIFSANQAAEAMLELTKSGITPAQTKAGALGATINLAATEGLELAKTAEIIGASLNTFGLRANESIRISDALAGGALSSSASVGGLALSLSQGGQGAAEMGVSLEETVGTLAAFAQNGIQASDAGTSLKTFLARLNPLTDKASKLMSRLGLDFFNSSGHMLSMRGIAAELQRELGGLSDEERGAAFNVLFGSDARRAANIVFKEGAVGLNKYITATEKQGAAEKMAQAQMTGLAGAIENLKGSLETAAVHFGHALAPSVEATATAIGGLADQFSALPPGIQTTVVTVAALTALAGPMLWFAGTVASAIIKLRELRALSATGDLGMFGKGKFMRRLGIAGLGIGAAQIGGGMVGGDLGSLVSNAGTGAAAGFALAGPLGGAIGGTAGTVLTAVQKLTSSEKQLTFEQQRLANSAKALKGALERQRDASSGLMAADQRIVKAQRRRRSMTQEMRQAQKHLGAVVSEYGARSQPAIHAEARLTRLTNRHRRAVEALQNAHKLQGVALSAYKTATNATVLAERHRISALTRLRDRQARLFLAAKQSNPESQRTHELSGKLLKTESNLAKAQKRHSETLTEAAQKGGKDYARFLKNAEDRAIRAGGAIKAFAQEAKKGQRAIEAISQRMSEMPPIESPTNPFSPSTPGRLQPRREGASNPRPAPSTRRLLAPVGDPRGSDRLRAIGAANGRIRTMQPVTVQIGARDVANAVVETQEDDEARL